MLDSWIRPRLMGIVDASGRFVARSSVSANTITVIGFFLGAASAFALYVHAYWAAFALLLVNRVFDGLDGAVARIRGPTDFGGYLDIVLDFIIYTALPFAFGLGHSDNGDLVPALVLVFSMVGPMVSFLAFGILAAKRNMDTTTPRGKKSFLHQTGLMEGTETIVFLSAFCLFPSHFALLAYVFAAMCTFTALQRIFLTHELFSMSPKDD